MNIEQKKESEGILPVFPTQQEGESDDVVTGVYPYDGELDELDPMWNAQYSQRKTYGAAWSSYLDDYGGGSPFGEKIETLDEALAFIERGGW